MKIKKKSIIIPAFTLLVGASLAGSISGTIAWYQFSTRANAAYIGVSGGQSGNLHIRFAGQSDDEWVSRITWKDVETYLASTTEKYGEKLAPVTLGSITKDAAIADDADFYSNPITGKGPYSKWQKASTKNYVYLPLEVRFVETINDVETNLARNIYLSQLLIQSDQYRNSADKGDISNAVRVHIHANGDGEMNHLLSLTGEDVATGGKLDLDNDGLDDQAYPDNDPFGFNPQSQLEDVIYGEENGKQTSYAISDMLVTPKEDLSLEDVADTKIIGKTPANGILSLDIKIWVEGWQQLDNSSLWDSKYIDTSFDVGFEFAVDPAQE